ncbi:platelet glycoprotein Ib alpha chain [Crotalus tigris]|uniref:platelet glycoprotein Ib alpha chain n=1 Tax=Crotalus tigris TaxID=88082 RepID=UPI00192F840E|nr:platelet glycoprotein Ib alpha chain [Crotalus tigris]
MLQGLLAPLLLAASVAAVAAMPPPEQCTSEMNKAKDLLEVSCVDKGLTSVPSGLPKDTGILLLADNQLAQVALASFQHLPELSKLDLSNNSLEVLETGAPLPKLEELLLSHNGLERLPAFSGLPALKRLNLGHNRLSWLPEGGFRDLDKLERLHLQANQLQTLPGGAFEGLEELMELDLSDNRLEVLPAELLAELSNLELLYLERNRLQRLPDGFFSEEAVYVYIYLVGNPWLCDCRLLYLQGWITNNSGVIYTRTKVRMQSDLEKEVTESRVTDVLCQAPPERKGLPVVNFTSDACKTLRDDDDHEGKEDEGGPADDSWASSPAPSPLTSTAAAPSASGPLAASSHSSSTAISPTGAALTTTSTSAVRPTTTHSSTATSPAPLTTFNGLTTTAARVPFGPSPTGATVGRSPAMSDVPMKLPGPSTAHVPPSTPQPLPPPTTQPHVPTTTSSTPFAYSPTALMLPTPLPPSPAPPTAAAAGPPPSTAALVPPTPARSSPRISAPVSTHGFSPPPPPKPSAHCLCPALPVRVLGVAARKGSPADWLAGYCCLLRLVLYLACLALVAVPTLAVLCCLGWLYLGWYRLALRGAPGSRLARSRQRQKASPKERRLKFAEAPYPTSGPRIYRVCKKFQVGPSRHVTWLLVSLPGSAGKRAQRQARLSSYSLDTGKDTLGAVRVKYTAASL